MTTAPSRATGAAHVLLDQALHDLVAEVKRFDDVVDAKRGCDTHAPTDLGGHLAGERGCDTHAPTDLGGHLAGEREHEVTQRRV
jgi:hypothetical protein